MSYSTGAAQDTVHLNTEAEAATQAARDASALT